MTKPILEFWYDFASTYSYLAAERLPALANAAGVRIVWKPFLLGPIFVRQGWDTSPFNIYPDKGRYMWRDMARLAVKYDIAFNRPSVLPRNSLHAARVALVGLEQGWGVDFTQAVYRANFVDDLDIAQADVIAGILQKMALPAADIIAASQTRETKDRLRANTDAAIAAHIFGAPSFIADDELFWGHDRMIDALDRTRASKA